MRPPLLALLASLLVLMPVAPARAQGAAPRPVDDIDLPTPAKPAAPAPEERAAAHEDEPPPLDDEAFVPGRRPDAARKLQEEVRRAQAEQRADAGTAAPDAGAAQAAAAGGGAVHAPSRGVVLPPRDGDAQLLAAWHERHKALQARSFRAAQDLERKMLSLREELGYANLFTLSAALSREAEDLAAEDPAEALRRAQVAAQLAPDSPNAHWTLARTAFRGSALAVGSYGAAAVDALTATWREPRWRAGMTVDVLAALLGALLLGGALCLLLVFARHARNFLHDFHHLFPTGASRLQTTILAALLLAAPLVLGLGPFAFVFAVALAVFVHMTHVERSLAAVLLALLAATPLLAGHIAGELGFSGTEAETLYLAERGGLEGPRHEARLRALTEESLPTFQALFASGHLARRRGEVEGAVHLLRRAAEARPDSVEALVELGSALFLMGDVDGAAESYLRASELAPTRAEAYFNLARLYAARAATVSREEASSEISASREYAQKASDLDPALGRRLAGEADLHANLYLLPAPMPAAAIRERAVDRIWPARVEDHYRTWLFGALSAPLAWLLSVGALGLLAVLWVLSRSMVISTPCVKCGRPVCRRCDAEVSGPGLCGQCLHVFNQRAAVDPPARVAKEIGIRRHQRHREASIKVTSVLLAGAGHVLLGRTLAGAGMIALVGVLAFPLLFQTGMVQSPAGEAPVLVRIIPAALALVALYAFAIRQVFGQFKPTGQKG